MFTLILFFILYMVNIIMVIILALAVTFITVSGTLFVSLAQSFALPKYLRESIKHHDKNFQKEAIKYYSSLIRSDNIKLLILSSISMILLLFAGMNFIIILISTCLSIYCLYEMLRFREKDAENFLKFAYFLEQNTNDDTLKNMINYFNYYDKKNAEFSKSFPYREKFEIFDSYPNYYNDKVGFTFVKILEHDMNTFNKFCVENLK